MPSNGKKQCLPPPYELSNLPENVIDEILMRLPLRDAVRTSILSKKWRCIWCRLPQLKLDQTLWKTPKDSISPPIGFINIVYHLLTLHTGQITKFILNIPYLRICPNIDNLIHFGARSGIQHVVLIPPLGNTHFIHLENVPLLSNVSYEPTEFSVDGAHDFAKIFESIPAVENLYWKFFNIQDVDAGLAEVIPTRLPSALNCLKRLYISWNTLGEFLEISFALCLIRSSQYLEEIEIKVYVVRDKDYYDVVPWDAVDEIPASFSEMTLNHLRTAKIHNVAGTEAEMQLIKVLLAKSPALVRMVTKPSFGVDKKYVKVLAVAEITKFQRVSSRIQVVYNVD